MQRGLLKLNVHSSLREDGSLSLYLVISHACGVRKADVIFVNGLSMRALSQGKTLPIEFPLLTEAMFHDLLSWSKLHKPLVVLECMAPVSPMDYSPHYLNLVVNCEQ